MQKKMVQIQLNTLDDLDAYLKITEKANQKMKGVVSELRALQTLYQDAANLSTSISKYKSDFEKLADDFKKMGVTNVNPENWGEYQSVVAALKDVNQTNKIIAGIKNALSQL